MNETARRCRALLLAGALAGPVRVALAQEPEPPRERVMAGGSVIILGTSGFSAPMLAVRATAINAELVAPDFTAGLYLHNGAELVDLALGIGRYVPFQHTGALTASVGPSMLVAVTGGGSSAVVGLQGRLGVVVPFDVNLGVRLEVGGSLYRPGQYTTQLWYFGIGLTTLGVHYR